MLPYFILTTLHLKSNGSIESEKWVLSSLKQGQKNGCLQAKNGVRKMGAFSQKNGCLQMILGQKNGCLRHKTRSEKWVPFERAIPYPACVCGFLKKYNCI